MKKMGFLLFLSFLLTRCQSNKQEQLLIATAANMQFAMSELTTAFTSATGISCEMVVSSSGKLTAQIVEGAPFDVLVSADMKYPTTLHLKGFTLESPLVYAYGKLVLWSSSGLEPAIEDLQKDAVKHIAVANPKTAPYGIAAMEVLAHYGLLPSVESKLVYGESVMQVNQFILSKAADLGFTAKSVLLSLGEEKTGTWIEIEEDAYSPIAQGIVVLKGKKKSVAKAKAFQEFLLSKVGREILHKFGYLGTEKGAYD